MNITKEFLISYPHLYEYIFVPHKHHGWLGKCQKAAYENEYPYFLWNDIVYVTTVCSVEVCRFDNASGKIFLGLL